MTDISGTAALTTLPLLNYLDPLPPKDRVHVHI